MPPSELRSHASRTPSCSRRHNCPTGFSGRLHSRLNVVRRALASTIPLIKSPSVSTFELGHRRTRGIPKALSQSSETMNNQPNILVTGSHRSGTTWVGDILSASPYTEYLHEPFNADDHERFADPSVPFRIKTWFLYAPGYSKRDQLRRGLDERFRRTTSPTLNAFEVCKQRGLIRPDTPFRFAKHFALRMVRPKRVIMKDPLAIFSAPWLHKTFNMDVVCLIRNPLAFVGSIKMWNWSFPFDHLSRQTELMEGRLAPFSDTIQDYSRRRRDIVDQATLLWNCFHHVMHQYQTEFPHWQFVRHEDLVQNPIREFSELCESLNLELTPSVTARIEEMTSTAESSDVASPTLQKRDRSKVLTSWRKRLTPEEVTRVIDATRSIACHFYELHNGVFQ